MNNNSEIILPDLNYRIKLLIEKLADGNVAEFVRMTNISSHQVLNRLFNIDSRTNKYPTPSSNILNNIKIHLKQVNYEWLITGEGEMLNLPKAYDNEKTNTKETSQIEYNRNPMTNDERIDALIRQNDALSETNITLTKALQDAIKASQDAIKASQDAIKMTHETISANQRQGETNQEIMKQLLSILEDSKKNSRVGDVPVAAIRAMHA